MLLAMTAGTIICMKETKSSATPTRTRELLADRVDSEYREEETPSFPRLLRRFHCCHIEVSSQVYTMAQAISLSSNPHCVIEAVEPYQIIHSHAALLTLLSSTSTFPPQLGAPFDNIFPIDDEAMHLMDALFGSWHPQSGYTTITLYPMCSYSQRNHPRYYFLEIVKTSNISNGSARELALFWKRKSDLAQQIVG
jgi:hypothetical protein